jgi:flavin reductase (DIM6/NTAB) family NADH-FMN oxidoreductase RutF
MKKSYKLFTVLAFILLYAPLLIMVFFSFNSTESTGVFTVNMPTVAMAEKVDYCGVASGRDVDKFEKCGFTAIPGSKVTAPVIAECPISLECQVKHTLSLGSHILYVGEVATVQVSSEFIDDKNHFDITKADLLAYAHGNYLSLGEIVGTFGFSVKKK